MGPADASPTPTEPWVGRAPAATLDGPVVDLGVDATAVGRPGNDASGSGWVPTGPGRWWVTLAGVVAVAAVVWLVVWVSAVQLPRANELFPRPDTVPGGMGFEGWVRWDAYWYRSIVADGYVYFPGVQSSVAFFPAYPLVLGALQGLFPSVFVTGSVVTLVSGVAALVVFRRWAGLFVGRPGATVALALLALFPYAYYLYGAVYADALFLLAAIGAFYALERDRVASAALLAAVASGCRPTGVIVALALVLRALELRNAGATRWRDRLDPRGLRPRDGLLVAGFAGLAAWMAYLWARFGDPLAFSTVQGAKGWDQPSGPGTWFKVGFVKNVFTNLGSSYTLSTLLSAALAVVVLGLSVVVWRRMGWSYGLYCLGLVAMVVIGSKDFMGTGRYLLGAFPAFAAAGGVLGERPRLRWAVPVASGLALVVLASAFARGTYLS
jgi:hypothetical protein